MPLAIYHRHHEAAARTALAPWCALGTAFVLLLTLPSPAHAQQDGGAPLSEAWVRVEDRAALRAAEAVGLTVAEGRVGDEQRILASPRALAALEDRGLPVRVTRADHRLGPPTGPWHDPVEGDALLRELVRSSDAAGIVQLGESLEGRPILGAWFGRPPDEGAPTWRVTAAHHGDEWSSFEVALDLATSLAAAPPEDATVWVIPYVNPDGVWRGSRYNAADVDLNRNYDVEWSAYSYRAGTAPFSEPETRAVRTHASWNPALASLSLHAGETNLGYVWNWSYEETPEEDVLLDLAEVYAAACDTPGFWVTNGADWYVTRGDANDWSYGRYGGMDFTVELTADKAPEEIGTFVAEHRDAVRAFLDVGPSLSGRVVDARTGQPLAATLVLHRDGAAASLPFATHPVAGTFHRIGTADRLEVRAPGYATRQVEPAAEIALDPVTVDERLPVRVPAGGWLALSGEEARLVRPAHAPVVLDVHGGGAWLDEVPAGPWTLEVDGRVHPHALVVEADGPARITSVERDGDAIVVRGEGFAEGTRAYALGRHLLPLPVTGETAEQVVVDGAGNGAVLLVSNGTELLATTDPAPSDTGPPRDTGLVLQRGSCACTTGTPSPWPCFLLLLLVLRRRTS